jgi:hypothetical protein
MQKYMAVDPKVPDDQLLHEDSNNDLQFKLWAILSMLL